MVACRMICAFISICSVTLLIFNFLPVALQPHGIGFLEPGIQIATIDHSSGSTARLI